MMEMVSFLEILLGGALFAMFLLQPLIIIFSSCVFYRLFMFLESGETPLTIDPLWGNIRLIPYDLVKCVVVISVSQLNDL